MIVYTVKIPIKKDIAVERIQTIIDKHSNATELIELVNGEDKILAYRALQGEWQSDIIFVASQNGKSITVNLNAPCERMPGDIAIQLPKLIATLYNAVPFPVESGYITSLAQPVDINLSDNFQNKCIEMFCGRGQGALPMIYVSRLPRYIESTYAVDPERLAKVCAGLACVVTEDSAKTSYYLSEKTEKRNLFNGYIGVYYPHIKAYDYYSLRQDESAEQLEYRIFNSVRTWWLNSVESEYTWNRLQIIKETQTAREERGEAERLIAAFEQEISDSAAENERLRYELQMEKDRRFAAEKELEWLRPAVQSKSKGCLLEQPNFEEWYAGEFGDITIGILKSELIYRTFAESRTAEILSALLEKNPIVGEGERILDEMTTAIREADSTEKMLSVLIRYGWEVVSKVPHIKLHYKGNSKYCSTLANSPSDKREKENFISDIMKMIDPRKGRS